ncbi:MAG: hypothetical protein Q7R57_08925, partial [Dehalococcoidales bacterium]|nr:hypothetical protein [Dehalococcoidales bacterium]
MIKREFRTTPSLSPKDILVRNYCMRDITNHMPVLAGNFQGAISPDVPKTADTRPARLQPGRTRPVDIVIFIGACEIALGWFLIIAMISFEVG